MIEFSIIIPIYNVEKYLEECLDSLLNQTYKNFEAILVNDGSQDGSGLICDRYVNIDSRFTVIHKINGGVSEARNCGLEKATGKWIMFLDGDDMLFPTALENLTLFFQKQSCEICLFAVEIFKPNQKRKKFLYYPKLANLGVTDGKTFTKYSVEKYKWFPKAAGGGVVLRTLLANKNIRYDTNYVAAEDAKFWYECISNCNQICYTPLIIYKYRVLRENSAMMTMNIEHIMSRFRYSIESFKIAFAEKNQILCDYFSRCAAEAVADLYKVRDSKSVKRAITEIESEKKIIFSAKGIKYRVASLIWLIFGFKKGSDVLQFISHYLLFGKYGR